MPKIRSAKKRMRQAKARTERNRDAAFDRLAAAGAELVTTEMVAFEWLGTAEHPRFREVLTLVK